MWIYTESKISVQQQDWLILRSSGKEHNVQKWATDLEDFEKYVLLEMFLDFMLRGKFRSQTNLFLDSETK
jgi:hypothetical protein